MRFSSLLPVVVRVLLGALFVFSGSNKVVPFMALPPMPEAGTSFLAALAATGYFLPLLGIVEVASGLALIAGRFVPLALVVLAPIVVNIGFFHAVLAPSAGSVVMIVGAELFLAWHYRAAFVTLLRADPAKTPATWTATESRQAA